MFRCAKEKHKICFASLKLQAMGRPFLSKRSYIAHHNHLPNCCLLTNVPTCFFYNL